MSRRIPGRSLAIAAFALAWAGASAAAQDLDEREEPEVVQNVFELHETNFNSWVFGQTLRAGSAQDSLESTLKLSVDDLERACMLTEAQKRKLVLAGKGDIKHFMDRVAEARKVFDLLRHDQNNIQLIQQETVPLGATLRSGLFGADSLFSKAISSTLAPDQAVRYRASLYEKDRFRHQSRIRLVISSLDAAMGMTAEERRRFTELALAETKPSRKPAGNYETQVATLKIARIPEEKLRAIFDENRLRALMLRLRRAEAQQRFLESSGYLEESEPPTAAEPDGAKKD